MNSGFTRDISLIPFYLMEFVLFNGKGLTAA
jgi:hypothetical protein